MSIKKWWQKIIDWIRGKLKEDKPEPVKPVPEPVKPEPEPIDPPKPTESQFSYEPKDDCIILTLPARFRPTRFYMFTNDGHIDLGTEGVVLARNEQGDYIYTLPGNGAQWAAKAVAASPRHYPSLQPFWKTADPQYDWVGPDGKTYNNVTYRIKDPTQSYGDEARIEPGKDH